MASFINGCLTQNFCYKRYAAKFTVKQKFVVAKLLPGHDLCLTAAYRNLS